MPEKKVKQRKHRQHKAPKPQPASGDVEIGEPGNGDKIEHGVKQQRRCAKKKAIGSFGRPVHDGL